MVLRVPSHHVALQNPVNQKGRNGEKLEKQKYVENVMYVKNNTIFTYFIMYNLIALIFKALFGYKYPSNYQLALNNNYPICLTDNNY